VEKARLAVPNAIAHVERKYLNRLYGRLLHCATPTGEKDPGKRRYLNIPIDLQDRVTLKQLEAIEEKVTGMGYRKTLDMYRDIVLDNRTECYTALEVLVVKAIHGECRERYRKPEFGRDPGFTCQLHLDYRVIRNRTDPIGELDKGARLLVDKENGKYHHFLEISNPVPRAGAIRIPVVMSARAFRRLDDESSVSSLSIEIGHAEVTVRAIIAKPERQAPEIGDITHLIGRDFGMVNTVSLSVVELDREIEPEDVERIAGFTRNEARKYLEAYSHPNDNIVRRIRFSGRKFLDSYAYACARIDDLKSRIDLGYNRLAKIKGIICGYLGIDQDGQLPDGMVFKDRFVQKLYDKFFRLLGAIRKMKTARLAAYARIRGVKKSWFGFISNMELALAKEFNAAIVREDLTILATEKASPAYKGRTFNKMINNGSKGQYLRMASDKLKWDGIPEILVPSYYTSTACTVHSLIDEAMRTGEIFRCPRCNTNTHADEHAADTLANYLLLRPA